MKYGINLTWNDLQKDAGALALVRQYLPAMEALASQAPGAARIAIRTAQGYAPQMFPAGQVAALDKALKAYGAAKPLSAEDTARVERYRALQAAHKVEAHPERAVRYDAFHPGRPWLDTNGNPIQAHGGAVYQEDGVWYWYGENKEFTDGKSPIWTWGIRMYRSTDLYNWQDLGLVALPDLTNPDGNLFPEKYVDRPHIIHCAATGKYVMWVKISSAEGCFTILQADRLQGPYTVVAEDYYPLGGSVGDFDLVVNGTQAYLYVDTTPKRVAGFALAPDFCSVTQEVSSQYEGLTPPFCREGVTLFAHGGKKYLITSGTTGYAEPKRRRRGRHLGRPLCPHRGPARERRHYGVLQQPDLPGVSRAGQKPVHRRGRPLDAGPSAGRKIRGRHPPRGGLPLSAPAL